ncbi:MAG: type VI secretion system tip protein VgrG [Acidobacteria bacterium]|nr:type VI secretion system tip protein VgrG [Acidobacteriota bacterium]MBV9475025.1 type VI secretion system tip protein VgrG [Acidobacteriota bacterium]
MPFTQDGQYISISTPLGKDKLLLRRFSGEEQLSGLFHYALEMQSEDGALDFSKIVGKAVTISIVLADGTTRYINGIVGRFVQAGADAEFYSYAADLYPWFWLTTMIADCRVYQNKSVIDIITGLFGELGFTDYKNSTTGTYAALEYCVQYNETVFAFVSRLLEDAGITYHFEHADGVHTLVLADDSSAYADCPGAATVALGTSGNWLQQNVMTSCVVEQVVIPGKYAVDDFGFETPSTDLMGSTDSTVAIDGSKRRIYEFPGGFVKKDAAETLAKLRMEEQESPQKTLTGTSFCRAWFAGAKTTLAGHSRDDVNTAYVVSRLVHNASLDGYGNSFEAFPATVTYRPPRVTRRPIIPGTQTAIVVGKSGEEIWTDKYGRVKVQFHWDQLGKNDENSSCWIRVAHGWAGKAWGQMFLPRIGQEVVVSFLEGNPDRPLITGAVYNAEQTVPYTLPADQTKSTIKTNVSKGGGGFNEIRFEDKKDSEELFVQAEKDRNTVVKNNDDLKVGFEKKDKGNQTIAIYNDRTVSLDEGNESLQVKKGNRTINVDKGNETHNVAGTRDVKVTKAETHTNEDNFDQKVTKNYTLKIDGNLEITVTGKVTIKSTQDMTLQSSAALTAKAGTDLKTEGLTISNKASTDLKNEGLNVTNKASVNLSNEGAMIASKASGMHNVEASGILVVKGSLVKIN